MFRSAHDLVGKKLEIIERWPSGRKSLFLGTLLVFAAIPLTVITVVSYRNLTSRAVTVTGPYGDCAAFGCTGPSLTQSWSSPTYRVRYECLGSCFTTGGFSAWVTNGSSRNFTAPSNFKIYKWEVQFSGLSGTSSRWYDYQSGNNGGSDGSISWGSPSYNAQLTHDTEFINACFKGLGGNSGRLANCDDNYSGSSTSTTFTGLSPNEYYDLFVFVRDKGGVYQSYKIINRQGPTGACTNCPVLPPPPASPPTKPANLKINFLPSCLNPGQAYGGTQVYAWTGSGATKYAVDISESANFSPGFTNKVVNGSTFSVTGGLGWQNQLYSNLASGSGGLVLQLNKTYYMRVFAESSAGSVYSETKTIFVPSCEASITIPPKPTQLTYEVNPFVFCLQPGQTYGSQVTFKFSGSKATRYAIDVADNSAFYPGFANKVIDVADARTASFSISGSAGWTNNLGTTYSLNGNLNLQPGKEYFWRVWANNNAGSVYSINASLFISACGNQPPTKPVITGDSDLAPCSRQSTWGITHAFSWSGGSGATEFWIDVSDSGNFARFVNKRVGGNIYATTGSGGWLNNTANYTLNGNLNLLTGRAYYFRIFAWNQYGGVHSSIQSFTMPAWGTRLECPPDVTPTPRTTNLLSPWQSTDIGDTGSLGGVRFDQQDGIYTANGSGGDIWNTNDAFRYAWMEMVGDGSISADVSAINLVSGTAEGWAKAGLMIRETTAANSKHAFIAVTRSHGVAFQFRNSTGGNSEHRWRSDVDGNRRPVRLLLMRTGSLFRGYLQDVNGSQKLIGESTISMNSKILVGFAITAHNRGSISSATFSRLAYNSYPPPTVDASNLRVETINCDVAANKARIKFKWDGPSVVGATYIVDITGNQSPYTRWSGSAGSSWFNNSLDRYVPKNGTEYTWGNIKSNTVHFWRVWNVHTRRHTYGAPFVPCQTKPSGAPVTGYLSQYFSGHGALDIALGSVAVADQTLRSTMQGRVVFAGLDPSTGSNPYNKKGYGYYVDIESTSPQLINGTNYYIKTRHAHMRSIASGITVGANVIFGTPLGIWGETGYVETGGGSNAIHDHYEIYLKPVGGSYTTYDPLDSGLNFNIQSFSCVNGACVYSPFW